jgi:transposase
LYGRWKKGDPDEPDDHPLGRSRGGFSTKISILCDASGLPLHFVLAAGQSHETKSLEELLTGADAVLIDGDGNAIPWPEMIAGDKGYRADWVDEYLSERGIEPVIPSRTNEDRDKRGIEFKSEAYRRRNIVERLIGWLKQNRRVFSRFEKTAKNFGGMIRLAFIRRYLRLICNPSF